MTGLDRLNVVYMIMAEKQETSRWKAKLQSLFSSCKVKSKTPSGSSSASKSIRDSEYVQWAHAVGMALMCLEMSRPLHTPATRRDRARDIVCCIPDIAECC